MATPTCNLKNQVVGKCSIYSEPDYYEERAKTSFSTSAINGVDPVMGFAGVHNPTKGDILIIAAGYEEDCIRHVAEKKNHAKKVLIYGFPPLRADMYQENILRAKKAKQSIGEDVREYLVPANDPFATADALRDIVSKETKRHSDRENIYLSPLATKPQVLGFALYYVAEKRMYTPTSIVFPFCDTYNQETSKGISRTWRYSIDLPVE